MENSPPPPGETFKQTNQHTRVHSSSFEQNTKIYLAAQQCGGGLHDSRVLGGMLELHSNPLKNAWYRISETVGLRILELGKKVLKENREVEKGLSPVAGKMYAISLCGDARWDKRSSGRNYSSLSGCSVALGCRSQLTCDIEPMSNSCIMCVRKIAHDDDVYAKNVTCSAKALEAVGSARIVNRVCR
jgi:hypothetical protein